MHMHDDSMKVELAQSLACVLASAYTVQLKLHGFHWNVKGKDFSEFHSFFGMLQEDIYESIDGIAENILKLGYDAPGSLSEMSALSCIDDKTVHVGEPIDMTMQFLHDNEMLTEKIQTASNIAESCREFGIMDFLAGREDMHKKWSWQARAISGLQPSRRLDSAMMTQLEQVMSIAPCCAGGCTCSIEMCSCPPECTCPCRGQIEMQEVVVLAAAQETTTEQPTKEKTEMKKLPGRKVYFSKETDDALEQVAKAHNAKTVASRATNVAVLKTIYRRGVHENIALLSNTRALHDSAMERVNAYIKLLRSGDSSSQSPDVDLLPAGHPRSMKSATAMTASMLADKEMYLTLKQENEYETVDNAILDFAEYSGLGYETIPAFKAAWTRAVRAGENPFRRAKSLAILTHQSKDADLLPKRKA